MQETLGFISFVPWTSIVMVLNLYILYRIVRHFLFEPVQEILRKRQEEIDAVYTKADVLQTEAVQAKQSYERRLSIADEEADQIITRSRETALQKAEKTQQTAKAEAAHILDKAETDAKQMRSKAMAQIQEDISDITLKIAQTVIEKEISEDDHSRFIKDFIYEIKKGAL